MTNKEKDFVASIRAMDYLARSINDEGIIESWLMGGVPDGDITSETTDEEILEMYDETNLKWFIGCFLRCMKRAAKDGLYVAGIVGTEED